MLTPLTYMHSDKIASTNVVPAKYVGSSQNTITVVDHEAASACSGGSPNSETLGEVPGSEGWRDDPWEAWPLSVDEDENAPGSVIVESTGTV